MSTVKKGTAEDPRYQRVRRSLRDAILSLAEDVPCEDLSAARVSAAAGVHRTSFYSHATSPTELLVEALREEFEPRFAALVVENTEPAEFWSAFYRSALDQVKKRKKIWILATEANSPMLAGMQRVFEESAREAFPQIMSGWKAGDNPLWFEVALQQAGLNLFALITAWSREEMKTPVDEVVAQYRTLAPPWQLARRDEEGVIEMERRR